MVRTVSPWKRKLSKVAPHWSHSRASPTSLSCCVHHLWANKPPPTLLVLSHSWEVPREACEIWYSLQFPVVIWDLVSRQNGQTSNPSLGSMLAPSQARLWRFRIFLFPLVLSSRSKDLNLGTGCIKPPGKGVSLRKIGRFGPLSVSAHNVTSPGLSVMCLRANLDLRELECGLPSRTGYPVCVFCVLCSLP